MTYKGHVEKGMIVLDESIPLEEGMKVLVDFAPPETKTLAQKSASFKERYAAVIGKAQGLPEDAAENHDHYLYGVPKK